MALKVGGDFSSEGGAKTVLVKDRFEVDPSKPLPQYNVTPALAYACAHKRDSKRSLFALVCDPKMPPRLELIGILHRLQHRSFIRVVDWGVAEWPLEGRVCPIIIYERPNGAKVFGNLTAVRAPMNEEKVTRLLIQPAAEILREMHSIGVYHRSIRPDNLFFDSNDENVILIGDCFVAPPGVTQPLPYEPLDTALSAPAGRGEGTPDADLFSLGATILALLSGRCPLAETDDETIIRARLVAGSYSALAQDHRVSLTMMEPLRGLLNDDPHERWSLEDLSLWVNGRRLSPKQQAMPTKASRSFTFAGHDYSMCRELAHAFHRDWEKASIAIKDGSLDTWLRRSLGEDDVVEAVNQAKSSASGGPGDEDDRLVSKIIISLDPNGPIRLRDYATTLDGVGTLIGSFYHDTKARNLFVTVVNMGLAHFWASQQRKVSPEHVRLLNRLDRSKAILNQTGIGLGIERAIYELNNRLPCMSKIFERDYVPTIEHIMPAFDRAAERDPEITRFIDRDVAAYLSTHFKRPLSNEFRDIEREGDEPLGRIAQMRAIATLQEAIFKGQEYHHLSAVGASILESAVKRFHSRSTRKRLRGKLKKAAKSGRMQDLLDIVDNSAEVRADQTGFDQARAEYGASVLALVSARRDRLNKDRLARDLGGQLSSALSLAVSMVGGIIGMIVYIF